MSDHTIRQTVRLLQSKDGRRMFVEALPPDDRRAVGMMLLTKDDLLEILQCLPLTKQDVRKLQVAIGNVMYGQVRNYFNTKSATSDYVPSEIDPARFSDEQLRELLHRMRRMVNALLPKGDRVRDADYYWIRREANRRWPGELH